MKKINFEDKKIGILGFGIENQALLDWLIKHEAKNITICDANSKLQILKNKQISNLKLQIGEDYLKNLEQFDIVFRTPAIPYLSPEIQNAKKSGVKISSQIKLFMDFCPCKTIGVTGTKGKGTTSTLIYEIIKSNTYHLPPNVYLAGNIGNAPIEFLDKLKSDDLVVLELSSFQLQDLEKSPHIAVVLDIKEDHLDYHKDRKEYIEAKRNIVKYQTKNDFSVINIDYTTSFELAALSSSQNYYYSRKKSVDLGTYVSWISHEKGNQSGEIILRSEKGEFKICKIDEITLRGEHNLENICAAIIASYLVGADIESIQNVVPKFPGLEHRLEFVKNVNGVKYYNDSFSTTPDTAIAAIESFSEPIILIVGGSEKGADYGKLGHIISNSTVKCIIAIGTTGPKIIRNLKSQNSNFKIVEDLKNMQEIITIVAKEAKPGDVVLLSPASASFDMFKNYKDRGNQFKSEVKKI